MGKAITRNAGTVVIDRKAERAIANVVKAFVESDSVHVRRTRAIGALVAGGMSVRQITDAVTVATGGATPTGFNASAVGRYRLVHLAITREDVAANAGTGDANAAIVAAFVRLAGPGGGAATVSAAADAVGAAKGSADAVDAARAHVAAFNAAQGKAAAASLAGETPSNRPVGGEAADGGKAINTADDDSDSDSDAKSTATNAADLASVGTAALIAELTRRYSGSRATVLSDDVEALTALASRVESLVTAGRVATKKK